MSRSVHSWSALLAPFARALVVAVWPIGSAAPVVAQEATSVEDLAAQATDPTASLMSVQLNDWYTANFRGIDDSGGNRAVVADPMKRSGCPSSPFWHTP